MLSPVLHRSFGRTANLLLTVRAAFFARLVFALFLVVSPAFELTANAQAPVDYAGIVIRPGDGTVTYAYVPLDEPVSGIELLRRSGISLLTVGFGGLGEGVCRIEETGCDIGPCRTRLCQTGDRESPYWRYFQRDETGSWIASPLGGSATRIAPGEVDGWAWTPDDGHLPDVAISAIPALARASEDLDAAHFAVYDESGNLLDKTSTSRLDVRSYLPVLGLLAAVALFAVFLRLRPRAIT
jgi:hypothetical protein